MFLKAGRKYSLDVGRRACSKVTDEMLAFLEDNADELAEVTLQQHEDALAFRYFILQQLHAIPRICCRL